MKDPAFLFYSNDFLSGTMLMSDEEIGKYIKLLCLQHQKGHLTEKDMLIICNTYNDNIFSKFIQDDDGNFYNERLEDEITRRKKYSESRRNNRLKKDLKDEQEKRYEKDMKNICNSYDKHMETETITENKNINKNININKIENIKNIYNEFCTFLPKIQKITEKRKTAISKLLKEITEDQFKEICIIANNSNFLIGDNDRNWKADFDFLIRTDKAVSILEGKYNNRKKDKLDGYKELWEEAKNEEERNDSNNNTFGW